MEDLMASFVSGITPLSASAANAEKIAATISPEDLDQYVTWRATGKSRAKSGELTHLTIEQVETIERSEGFDDAVEERRQEIIDDPEKMIASLMPQAIGVLMKELAEDNVVAAKEMIKLGQSFKTARSKQQEETENDDRRITSDNAKRKTILRTAETVKASKADSQ